MGVKNTKALEPRNNQQAKKARNVCVGANLSRLSDFPKYALYSKQRSNGGSHPSSLPQLDQ